MKPLNETSAERLERLENTSPSGGGGSATPSLGGIVVFAVIIVAILGGMLIYGLYGSLGNYYETVRDLAK